MNIREFLKEISRTTLFYLKDDMISSAQRSDHDNIFFDKNMDRIHFSENYGLSAMKKRFKNKKKQTTDS